MLTTDRPEWRWDTFIFNVFYRYSEKQLSSGGKVEKHWTPQKDIVLMTSFLNIKALFFHSGLKGLQNSASDKMWREQDGETRQIMKAGLYPRISLNPDEQSQKILIRRHISEEAVRRLLYFSSGDLKRNVITLVKEVNMQGLLYYS